MSKSIADRIWDAEKAAIKGPHTFAIQYIDEQGDRCLFNLYDMTDVIKDDFLYRLRSTDIMFSVVPENKITP